MLTVGDGAVWTNLDDMAAWDRALRNHKLIREKTMQLALGPSKTTNGKTNDYGLGWLVYRDKSGNMNGFGHEGSWTHSRQGGNGQDRAKSSMLGDVVGARVVSVPASAASRAASLSASS